MTTENECLGFLGEASALGIAAKQNYSDFFGNATASTKAFRWHQVTFQEFVGFPKEYMQFNRQASDFVLLMRS